MSFMRFLKLGLGDHVPDAKTIWLFKDTLTKAVVVRELFNLYLMIFLFSISKNINQYILEKQLVKGISKNRPPIILVRLFPHSASIFLKIRKYSCKKIDLIGEKIPNNLTVVRFLEMP